MWCRSADVVQDCGEEGQGLEVKILVRRGSGGGEGGV